MNRFCVFIILLAFCWGNHASKAEEKARKSDISASKQLLAIAAEYLKAASSGDYTSMQQFAAPGLKHITLSRGGPIFGSNGRELTQYWYISSIARRNNGNIYDIVLECYAPDDEGYRSTQAHAVAKWQQDRYVLTEW